MDNHDDADGAKKGRRSKNKRRNWEIRGGGGVEVVNRHLSILGYDP